MTAIEFHPSPAFVATAGLDAPAPAVLSAQGVDAQLLLPGMAHASLWWRTAPPLPGERLGVIGHFRASPLADAASVAQLLDAACRALEEAGCTRAIGPMDGNTWRSYRFVTWQGGHPRFALEPSQPATWPGWWQAAGFTPYEEYWSSKVDHLAEHDVRLDDTWQRLHAQGISIRAIDVGRFDRELDRIYAVSAIAFRDNVLYTPLPRDAFLEMYQGATAVIRPELCFIAELDEQPIGFVFAIPDFEQARRGETVDTVVVKTLAILPVRAYAGLGRLLLARCQQAAASLGLRWSIHALMHQRNRSRNLGGLSKEIRRYTLFARPLG